LDVEELLAIAVVFSVPPIALLVDPTIETMSVTPRVEVPTAYALLWLVGDQPLHGMTGVWEQETMSVRFVRRLHEHMRRCLQARLALHAIERLASEGSLDPDNAVTRRNEQERELFVGLVEVRDTLTAMRRQHMALPQLIEQETLGGYGQITRHFTACTR
jgi:hypothetical protein